MALPLLALLALGLGGEAIVKRGRRRGGFLEDALGESQESKQERAVERRNQLVSGLQLPQGVSDNEFDFAADRQMAEQFEQAKALLNSPDPKLQALGAQIMNRVQSESIQATQANETQFRNELEANRTLSAETAATAHERTRGFQTAIRENVLDPYFKTKQSYENVLQLLDGGDRLTTLAALVSFIQSIDDSVVREGELLLYRGQNGFVRNLTETVNEFSGKDFTGEFRQTILNGSAGAFNGAKIVAAAKLRSFQTEAASVGGDLDKIFAGAPNDIFDRSTNQNIKPILTPIEAFVDTPPEGLVPFRKFEQEKRKGVVRAAPLPPLPFRENAFVDPKTGDVWLPNEETGNLERVPPHVLEEAAKVFGVGIAELLVNLPADLRQVLRNLGN